MSSKFTVKRIAYMALCIALATVLSQFQLFSMPQGGSVTLCSMLFVSLAGYFYGPALGISAGVVFGLIRLAAEGYIYHPAQVILDYPLAFGALGLSGFFKDKKYGLELGFFIGATGRFIMSFFSGLIFFYNFVEEPFASIWGSAVYNFPYIAVECAITALIIRIPSVRSAIEHVKRLSLS